MIASVEIKNISPSKIRELSLLQWWRPIIAIGINWAAIIAAIYLFVFYPYLYIVTFIVIASRMYALYSLLHEAVHYSLYRNKFLNDTVAQIFLGMPLGISLPQMRKIHLAHHKYLHTSDDPEYHITHYSEFMYPKSSRALLKILMADLLGVNSLKYYIKKHMHKNATFKNISAIIIPMIFGVVLGVFLPKLLFYIFFCWILPYTTLYQLLNRIRLTTEHLYIPEDNIYQTRSVIGSLIDKLIFVPHGLGYHIEHHTYPSIPYYRLHDIYLLFEKYDMAIPKVTHFDSYSTLIKYFRKQYVQ